MAKRAKPVASDPLLNEVQDVFGAYRERHKTSRVDVYRHNAASIRVRIIDPAFRGLDRVQREAKVWTLMDQLSDDARSDVSVLLLITPEEKQTSLMNLEFEDPTPSRF